ncbi:MAG: phosphotransferase family protein [Dehalococcoidia bacterium]
MDWRAAFAKYLSEQLPAATAVEVVRVGGMPAGASNETIGVDVRVTCDGVASDIPLVLRPQRRGGILAPYDVGRQYRIVRALAQTDVPVPPVAWFEPTGDVLGVPFYAMYRLRCETPPLFWHEGPTGKRVQAAAAALAKIHAVDWRGHGLDFLLPAEDVSSPIQSELALWRVKGERMGIRGERVVELLEAYLVKNEPKDARLGLTHGDTNAGNYLFRGSDVVAVVDWELSALGDPRSDLGFYSALMDIFGGYADDKGGSVLSEAHAAVTGTPLHNLEYYAAFGIFRMMVVMAGWGGGGFWSGGFIVRRLDQLLGPHWAA